MTKFTNEQQKVIDFRGKRLLVSASAGTGKTTVMIQRILSLIADGADVSQFVVVTFTNLAAAEMKARLSRELSKLGIDRRMVEQLEKLDGANISTIHSFCSELLRRYFYLVDIDPAYQILDNVTVDNLKQAAIEEVFASYFDEKDEVFGKVYKIFSKNRQEDNFKKTIFSLYEFARGLENFEEWYLSKRDNFVCYSQDNPLIVTLTQDVKSTIAYCAQLLDELKNRALQENLPSFADVFETIYKTLQGIDGDLYSCVSAMAAVKFAGLPRRKKKKSDVCSEIDNATEEQIRNDFDVIKKTFEEFAKKYTGLFRGMSMQQVWEQTASSVLYTDKLVEIVNRFDNTYYAAKKQRGGIDFGDLEHLALKILREKEVLTELSERYKYIFVDEYQDTSPIQESIVQALSASANLFMVGDVKQSIYGFRGCEPEIFIDKYNRYKSGVEGEAVRLNDNFRTNNEIFDFVNLLFGCVMTQDFGRVDYANDAKLVGPKTARLPAPSVTVNLVVPPKGDKKNVGGGLYDITQVEQEEGSLTQAKVVVNNVQRYVGTKYVDENGVEQTIGYGDIVVLTRSLKDRAVAIYDALCQANIPVVANFKASGYQSKEIRDVINLLRVVDNPYNDVYIVGVCLSSFGQMTETQLGQIRLDTAGRIPFYDRMRIYSKSFPNSEISRKIDTLLDFIDKVRFFSRGATVCETVLYAIKLSNYQLYVTGLPNGGLRTKKLYSFVDSLKGAAYGESVDKFLQFIDESQDDAVEEGIGNTNAVRMMTMHASKGLEFPVVIVAATENKFNLTPEPVLKNVDMGLAVEYYDFDTMRVSKSIAYEACGMFNKTKQREEEMRLLYVALTRAKYVLNIVGNVTEKQLVELPCQPTKANSHLDWILYALRSRYSSFVCNNDKLQIVVNKDLPQNSVAQLDLLCRQTDDLQGALEQINYRYPYLLQTDMPLKVVSSALDKQALIAAEEQDSSKTEVLVDDNAAESQAVGKQAVQSGKQNIPQHVLALQAERNKVGSVYHKLLQYAPLYATESQLNDILQKLAADGTVEKQYADQVELSLVCKIVNSKRFVELLSRGKVYRELPFMLNAPYCQLVKGSKYTDEVMLQGIIDLLVVDGDSATVVDYKLTKHSDTVAERYSAQLNSYRLAVQKIFGINNVKCFVLSIADNKIIEITEN